MENLITSQNLATIAMALVMAFVLYRSKTSRILREELDANQLKTTRLEKENEELKTSSHDKDVLIANLKARTDLTDIRAGQASILEVLSKQGATHLKLLETAHESARALGQAVVTLKAMEKRLERGLVMQ